MTEIGSGVGLVLALIGFVSTAPPAAAQIQPPAPEAASGPADAKLRDTLISLERRSWEAWKSRDGKFFQDFLSDDHVEVGFSGVADKAAVVGVVASPVCVVRTYAVDRFRVTAFDANTALLTYWARQDTTCGGKPVPSPVWASSLYVRRGGRWWNAVYQQTQAAGSAPPAAPATTRPASP